MASPSGSQNQAWDCDSGRNFREEIETGCLTTYTENYRDDDGDDVYQWNNILCAGGEHEPPAADDRPGAVALSVGLRHHRDRRQDRSAAGRSP